MGKGLGLPLDQLRSGALQRFVTWPAWRPASGDAGGTARTRRAARQQDAASPKTRMKWNAFMRCVGGQTDRLPRAERIAVATPKGPNTTPGYFCQVRFLWRLARSFLRRLCLLILLLRRFFK